MLFPRDGAQIRLVEKPNKSICLFHDKIVLSTGTSAGRHILHANLDSGEFQANIEKEKNSNSDIQASFYVAEHLLVRVLKNGAIVFEFPSAQRRKVKNILGEGSTLEVRRTITRKVPFVVL